MTPATQFPTVHVFERAGLGRAPFRFTGAGREVFQAVPGARVMVYAGHAYSPWAGSGRRQYSEPRDSKTNSVRFPCGALLDEVFAIDGGRVNGWAPLKSKRSREAKLVTCPVCVERIRAAGFVHAPTAAVTVSP